MVPHQTQAERRKGKESMESVFEEIYFSNFEKIRFYAQSYLRDQAQAQCVAQDVFLALWEKMEEAWSETDATPLLFVIAKYKCMELLKAFYEYCLPLSDHPEVTKSLK